jgi:hypothetical protein
VGRPHVALWAASGHDTSLSLPGRAGCTHYVCGLTTRVSTHGQFSNRNLFLFYSEFISDSNFENSYLDIQSSKNYETSSVGFIIL